MVNVLLADPLTGSNADILAWMVTSPTAAVPVNATVISIMLTKETESSIRPVVPNPTVKSDLPIPDLKFIPVTVTDGVDSPITIMGLVIAITGAASVTVTI